MKKYLTVTMGARRMYAAYMVTRVGTGSPPPEPFSDIVRGEIKDLQAYVREVDAKYTGNECFASVLLQITNYVQNLLLELHCTIE